MYSVKITVNICNTIHDFILIITVIYFKLNALCNFSHPE